MKRIKSFKLFENKDHMDLINNVDDLIQNLWDNCRDLEYFDKGFTLKVQAYIESEGETEWFLDTSFESDSNPESLTCDLGIMRDDVEKAYLSGSKPHLRFGVISVEHLIHGISHRQLLLDQTNKLYDIAKRELTSDIELVKLCKYDHY